MPHCGTAVIVLEICIYNAVFFTKLSNASSQGSPLRVNVPWHRLSLSKACPMPREMGRLGIDRAMLTLRGNGRSATRLG